MKKVVLKLNYSDEKMKAKAMQRVSGLHGLESIALDGKDKKLTVVGDIDPVSVVGKLRKICHTEILSVGPAKEPEKKKEEPKKEEPKKEEAKKPEAPKPDQAQLLKAYQAQLLQQQQQQLQLQQQMYQYQQQQRQYYQAPNPTTYFNRSVEEDPNGCVIC